MNTIAPIHSRRHATTKTYMLENAAKRMHRILGAQ
jgi:hypothetical protein